jgi:8-oxo-dGTP pyrophosphatase MutT (NUDIX family)
MPRSGAPSSEGENAAPPIGRWCAAAILLCANGRDGGRYLMQLRDPYPDILLPDHWSLFGGTVDPGEDDAAAIVRELAEELEFRPRRIEKFTEMTILLPFPTPRLDRMSMFVVPFDAAELAAMVQHEGAGKRLFTPEELAQEPRVAPWDLAAVMMHARQTALFGR